MHKKEMAFNQPHTRHACISHCQRTEGQKSGDMRTQRVSLVQRRDAPSPLDTVTLSQFRFDRSNRSRECKCVAAISIFIRQIIAKSITSAARKRTAPSCSHSSSKPAANPLPSALAQSLKHHHHHGVRICACAHRIIFRSIHRLAAAAADAAEASNTQLHAPTALPNASCIANCSSVVSGRCVHQHNAAAPASHCTNIT